MKPKTKSYTFKNKTKQKEQEKKATDFYIQDCKILRFFATSPFVEVLWKHKLLVLKACHCNPSHSSSPKKIMVYHSLPKAINQTIYRLAFANHNIHRHRFLGLPQSQTSWGHRKWYCLAPNSGATTFFSWTASSNSSTTDMGKQGGERKKKKMEKKAGENGSWCQNTHVGEQEVLERVCKPWYVILALVCPPGCIIKPFRMGSSLVNLMNFVSELSSPLFGHEWVTLFSEVQIYWAYQSCERKTGEVAADFPSAFTWKTAPGKHNWRRIIHGSTFLTPLPSTF